MDDSEKGCCLKSWDSICTPKNVGGLGIKKISDMNKALVAKMTWNVVNNSDKMWVMAFKKKYVWNRKFMKMSILKGVSWAPQSIFECRKVISKGLCHRIGNGLNTWIFEDPWVPNEPGFIPQARCGISIDVHLVANLIDQDTKQWDKGKHSILFEPPIVIKILNIHLSHQTMNDQVF